MDERFDYIRRKLVAKQEQAVRELMGGVTSVVATPQEPLTLDKLLRLTADMRAQIGPTPAFLSSKLFPYEKAFVVEDATTKYTCAHPSFWTRFEYEARRNTAPKPYERYGITPIFGIRIEEIDLEGDTSKERRAYLRGIWADLIEAVKVAMVPLPEWLRSAPR